MSDKNCSAAFAALLLTCSSLAAQPAILKAPDGGSLLQQLNQLLPSTPSSDSTGLMLEQEDGRSAKMPTSTPFLVTRIRITRNTLFDTPTLRALVADGEGKNLTLIQIAELAARITKHYRANGYPLARAIIPAQTITAGLVRIEVIEAVYGKIELDNNSRVRDVLLQSTLSALQSGEEVEQVALDHALLLLSDVPGVAVKATFSPGETVGSSDLSVVTSVLHSLTGDMSVDNYGNPYTGEARVGGSLTYYNPLRYGDTLNLAGLTTGSGLTYGRLAYETMVSGQGTRVGASYSALTYRLGGIFARLGESGSAEVQSLWTRHPLVRSRNLNLYGQLQYDRLRTRSRGEQSGLEFDRSLDNWTFSLAGDARDALFVGSMTQWKVGVTQGHAGPNEAALPGSSTELSGNFSRMNADLAHLTGLSSKNSLYLAYAGQWASANLVASQKMSIGGPYTVRAYGMGALSGDIAHLLSVELRHELGQALQGQWQVIAFVDSAYVQLNKSTSSSDLNSTTLSGGGFGLNWNGLRYWSVRALVAKPLGSPSALVGDNKSYRGWIELHRRF